MGKQFYNIRAEYACTCDKYFDTNNWLCFHLAFNQVHILTSFSSISILNMAISVQHHFPLKKSRESIFRVRRSQLNASNMKSSFVVFSSISWRKIFNIAS